MWLNAVGFGFNGRRFGEEDENVERERERGESKTAFNLEFNDKTTQKRV